MKIVVDAQACTGHARCIAYGPEVFVLDDEGYNKTNIDDVPPELFEQARAGAEACPERAITIVE
jgi:ferredoxin